MLPVRACALTRGGGDEVDAGGQGVGDLDARCRRGPDVGDDQRIGKRAALNHGVRRIGHQQAQIRREWIDRRALCCVVVERRGVWLVAAHGCLMGDDADRGDGWCDDNRHDSVRAVVDRAQRAGDNEVRLSTATLCRGSANDVDAGGQGAGENDPRRREGAAVGDDERVGQCVANHDGGRHRSECESQVRAVVRHRDCRWLCGWWWCAVERRRAP